MPCRRTNFPAHRVVEQCLSARNLHWLETAAIHVEVESRVHDLVASSDYLPHLGHAYELSMNSNKRILSIRNVASRSHWVVGRRGYRCEHQFSVSFAYLHHFGHMKDSSLLQTMLPDDKLQISNDEGSSLSNESKRRGALQLERHVARRFQHFCSLFKMLPH